MKSKRIQALILAAAVAAGYAGAAAYSAWALPSVPVRAGGSGPGTGGSDSGSGGSGASGGPVVATGPGGERLVRTTKFAALGAIWSMDCSSSCGGVAI